MHDVFAFMDGNPTLMLFIVFIVAVIATRFMTQWHVRRLENHKNKARLQILEERRRIVEAEGDAIKLLVVDAVVGADFERRLHEALEQARHCTPKKRLQDAPDPQLDDELGNQESTAPITIRSGGRR